MNISQTFSLLSPTYMLLYIPTNYLLPRPSSFLLNITLFISSLDLTFSQLQVNLAFRLIHP